MFTETLQPRFLETDALGHINNTVIPQWFEQARTPIFKLFTPDLNVKNWSLILARIEIDFLAELHYGKEVSLKTGLTKIGRSSMHILQTATQSGTDCARGKAIIVHYDFVQRQSLSLPTNIRHQLEQHLVEDY